MWICGCGDLCRLNLYHPLDRLQIHAFARISVSLSTSQIPAGCGSDPEHCII
jgi:hypothetical protein